MESDGYFNGVLYTNPPTLAEVWGALCAQEAEAHLCGKLGGLGRKLNAQHVHIFSLLLILSTPFFL